MFLLLAVFSAGYPGEKSRRMNMVDDQIARRGVRDARVLEAMRKVPRHLFVPREHLREAYSDYPLSIGHGQTISQPYIVAYMTEQLMLTGSEKVLEIGTGSGYQAAVLAETADSVFSIEIICELEESASKILAASGYRNVFTKCADGYQGWPEHAPFDRIILTAAPRSVPPRIIDQLKPGGVLIAPVGDMLQDLVRITKTDSGYNQERLIGVRFVPMTGKFQD